MTHVAHKHFRFQDRNHQSILQITFRDLHLLGVSQRKVQFVPLHRYELIREPVIQLRVCLVIDDLNFDG